MFVKFIKQDAHKGTNIFTYFLAFLLISYLHMQSSASIIAVSFKVVEKFSPLQAFVLT